MSSKLKQMLTYFITYSKSPSTLTSSKLTRLVYLADWLHYSKKGVQVTEIKWQFNGYAPHVSDVNTILTNDSNYIFTTVYDAYGNSKEVVKLKSYQPIDDLELDDLETLKNTLEITDNLNWLELTRIINNTAPVKFQDIDENYLDFDRVSSISVK